MEETFRIILLLYSVIITALMIFYKKYNIRLIKDHDILLNHLIELKIMYNDIIIRVAKDVEKSEESYKDAEEVIRTLEKENEKLKLWKN